MTFKDPALYVFIVNVLALIWAVRSWRKGIREKWMNSVRDTGSEILAAAELVYWDKSVNDPQSKASFMEKESKLLLLFTHNEAERTTFGAQTESLRKAAESHQITAYRHEYQSFYNAVNARVLKEWKAIKCFI